MNFRFFARPSGPDAAHPGPSRRSLTLGVLGVAGVAGLGLSGCSQDPNSVAAQAKSGDRKGYVSGDGAIETIAADQRGEPISLSGTTLEGTPWSSAGRDGTLVVLNVWGSWCPPCIKETPALEAAWKDVQARRLKVEFLGLNSQESPETALAFVRANSVTYPSLAYDGGIPLLALQGKVVATPTTMLLDRQGRIAVRVSGEVTKATLVGLIDDLLAQDA